eukprot:1418311-Rhodomonas_salina.2
MVAHRTAPYASSVPGYRTVAHHTLALTQNRTVPHCTPAHTPYRTVPHHTLVSTVRCSTELRTAWYQASKPSGGRLRH